jgi:tRNA/tmRNA/rRNA uracil-C5-methylase (TrmA/RlmC/RlmD family)
VHCKVERLFPARNLAIARALRIVDEGPLRAPRLCPHAAPCPACPLEGLEPSAGYALKRGRVERALLDAGLDLEVDDVMAPEDLLGARQKVKLVAGGVAGRLKLGLFVPHSHVVVGAEECPYVAPELHDVMLALRDVLDAHRVPPAIEHAAGVKAVLARAYEEGPAAVVVVGAPLPDDVWSALAALVDGELLLGLAERVDTGTGNSLLGGDIGRTVGPQALTPLDGGAPVEVDAFCQADADMAAVLYDEAAAFLVEHGASGTFVDAYAGTGGFARALLARGVTTIVAIERAPASASALQTLPVEAHALSVEDALPLLATKQPLAGLVLDPPRKGVGDLVGAFSALGAPRIALASCDPDAMARDLKALVAEGYRVVRIVPVDLFAGTTEVEVLTLLER